MRPVEGQTGANEEDAPEAEAPAAERPADRSVQAALILPAYEALPRLEELAQRHPDAPRVVVYEPHEFAAVVSAAEQGHRFIALHAGYTDAELAEALRAAATKGDTVRDPVGCAARLRRAASSRELWFERLSDEAARSVTPATRVDVVARRLFIDGAASEGLAPGETLLGGFEGWDHAYSFLTFVVDHGAQGTELSWPRFLRRRARRKLRRPRAVLEAAVVAFTAPGGDVSVEAPLTSLTTRGASFECEPEREVPAGTPLGTVTLRLPGSEPIDVEAHVATFSARGRGGAARCGIAFDRAGFELQSRVADALLPLTFPGVRAADGLSFERLWALLRDSGFIYPAKAAQLEPMLPQVRHTLTTLLAQPDGIFKTLVHESGGQLQGHLSAVRAYRDTWLIQHLATRKEGPGRLAAARDLNLAISLYAEQVEALQWIRVFFRPQNRWPDRTFGRFARLNLDRETCDLTHYGYFVAPPLSRTPTLREGLRIEPANEEDEALFTRHLAATEPAMNLAAEDLRPGAFDLGEVSEQFAAVGLERTRELWVCRRNGRAAAFSLLESSSPGLNFSELTSALRVFPLGRDDGDAARALARHARVRAQLLGRPRCVAVDSGRGAADLEGAGFTRVREYACWTLHRSRFRRYHAFLRTLYGTERRHDAEDAA